MKRFRNILVGVDLTNVDPQMPGALGRPSRRAIARAIWLAAHTGGKLTILSAATVSPFIQDLLQEHRTGTHNPLGDEKASVVKWIASPAKYLSKITLQIVRMDDGGVGTGIVDIVPARGDGAV